MPACQCVMWLFSFMLYDFFYQQQHKNLKSSHDQLVLTLEDHKSALAAAQVKSLIIILILIAKPIVNHIHIFRLCGVF